MITRQGSRLPKMVCDYNRRLVITREGYKGRFVITTERWRLRHKVVLTIEGVCFQQVLGYNRTLAITRERFVITREKVCDYK